MLISSKEKLTTAFYPDKIRQQIRKELIEQQILQAQEFCMLCFIVGDLDSMIFFYKSQINWESILNNVEAIYE